MDAGTAVSPRAMAGGSVGTDEARIQFSKADAKPKIKLQKEAEGWDGGRETWGAMGGSGR